MDASTVEAPIFEAATEADWRAHVDKALKGGGFETLVTRTEDGLAYGPLHERRRGAKPLARSSAAPWAIIQRIDDPQPDRANRQALDDLAGGAMGLALVLAGVPSANGFGLPDESAARQALAGVDLGLVHLRLEPGGRLDPVSRSLRDMIAAAEAADVDWGHDPVGQAAFEGGSPQTADAFARGIGERAAAFLAEGIPGRLLRADGRVFHAAGATHAQELGAVLASGVFMLRAMEGAGIAPAPAGRLVELTLAADQRQFETTAKFRAMRLLWARLLEACGVEAPDPARIHAETTWRMMAAKDPNTNILRATIACFAAATGGADSIAVLPHTAALGLADPAARRLARNLQVILQEESGLARVADPAAGSGGIETLTDLLAEAAWEEFRRIESEGGILGSLQAGALQSRIFDAREGRAERIAKNVDAVVGVNLYPMAEEREHGVLAAFHPSAAPETAGAGTAMEPLRPHRATEHAEATP